MIYYMIKCMSGNKEHTIIVAYHKNNLLAFCEKIIKSVLGNQLVYLNAIVIHISDNDISIIIHNNRDR